MPVMSRTTKLAITFSAIGVAIGIGITIVVLYNQTGASMFQSLAGGVNNNDYVSNQDNEEPTLGFITHYKAILAVGEEGTYSADSKFGQAPFSFEWKFSDGLTLTGQQVTRTFDLPGKYSFYLTVTDGTGKKVTSTELNTNVVQQMAKKE